MRMENKKSFIKLNREDFSRAADYSLSRLTPSLLHYLEDCVGCMSCRVACPFWYVDHRYSPVNKAEELRKIMRKKITVSGKILGKIVKAELPSKDGDLERIVELAYKCTECSTCYITCPFGIDSGELLKILRSILYTHGTVPTLFKRLLEMEVLTNNFIPHKIEELWHNVLEKIEVKIGKKPPIDQTAETVFLPTVYDALLSPNSIVSTAQILEHAGIPWTMPSKPIIGIPMISWYSGSFVEAITTGKIIMDYVRKHGGRTLLLVDGGSLYYFLRWVYPELSGEKYLYETLHVTELVYKLAVQERIKLKTTNERITWHSPCKLGRKSGVIKEPVSLLKRLSNQYVELPHHGTDTICCGGGNGILLLTGELIHIIEENFTIKIRDNLLEGEENFLYRQERTYYLSLRRKAKDIEKIKPQKIITGCPTCIFSLKNASILYGVEYEVKHFSEYVAENLET